MIVTKAPGKLFIAGEYAVTHPSNTAILVSVDKFIKVFLEKSNKNGSVCIYDDKPISWVRKTEKIILKRNDTRLQYVLAAINIVEKYAKELGRKLSYYHLRVSSDLETQNGIKYGLGSSAAVTVATISALCSYFNIDITKEKLFKLSAMANLSINNKGSCGDIAACVYGGWIAYTGFDRGWVLDKMINSRNFELLSLEWPGFKVEPLIPPNELNLVIGWTGQPSSTTNLVDKVRKRSIKNIRAYNNFLSESKKCVTQMINAFKDNNINEIQKQMQNNRELLVKMGNDLGAEIETYKLKKLCDIALKYNGSAKPSGAGGGDCGIAIFKGKYNLSLLIEEWKKFGITYLPLNVYYKKGDCIDK